MAYLTTLDVVNTQLATLGETPLNSVDEDHPFVAAGLQSLRTISNREQAKGWWFNKEIITLVPDPVTKNLMVPADSISVNPSDPGSPVVQRGRRMYNPLTTSYEFTTSMECLLIRRLEFEELPDTAADFIMLSATWDFQSNYDADQAKVRKLEKDLARASITINAEHIRQVGVNFLNRPATALALNRLGYNPQLGGLRTY